MLTANEHRQLLFYWLRNPWDDESNHQLPSAMLRSQVTNMFRKAGTRAISAEELMPFKRRWLAQMEQEGDIEDMLRTWAKLPDGDR